MPRAPYRVVFYREAADRGGLPLRLSVATMTLDDAASRESAIMLAIARFRKAFPGVHWIDVPWPADQASGRELRR